MLVGQNIPTNQEINNMDSLRYYHYRRLSSKGKEAYKKIVQAIRRFSSCVVIDSIGNLHVIVDAVKNDNPHFYYVDWSVLVYSCQLQGLKTVLRLNYLIGRIEAKNYYYRIKMIAQRIKGNTEFSTIRNVHDYLAKTIKYNHDAILKKTYNVKDHNVIGPLFESKGVCEGISRAAQILLRILNVECTYQCGLVDSKTNSIRGLHAWNLINIKGKVKKMDITWDLSVNGKVSHKYFAVPEDYV